MSTRRQRAASRANGQKSQGPVTVEGKAKSRFNALKHGIDAKQQIMFAESAEDLAHLAAEYHELHSPANADERFLVDTMVNNEWRLRRLRCVEAELWRAASQRFVDTHNVQTCASGDAFTGSGPAFERLQRIMNSCERHYRNARKELQAAQAARTQPQTTPQPKESTATSESSGSIHTTPENASTASPQPPSNPPKTAPESSPHLAASAAHSKEPANEQIRPNRDAVGATGSPSLSI